MCVPYSLSMETNPYGYPLEKVGAAIGKLVLRGSIQERVNVVLANFMFSAKGLPEGDARDMGEHVDALRDKHRKGSLSDDEAEDLAKSLWTLRAMLDVGHRTWTGLAAEQATSQ